MNQSFLHGRVKHWYWLACSRHVASSLQKQTVGARGLQESIRQENIRRVDELN